MADMSKVGRSNVRKSKNHERRVKKLLTDWSNIEFRRRLVEGRSTDIILVDGTADIISVGKSCKFSIEAKSGSGFSLNAVFTSPQTSKFTEWWFQTCYDAHLISKALNKAIYPFLFFKPHPQHDWVAFDVEAYDSLKFSKTIRTTDLRWFSELPEVTMNVSRTANKKLYTMKLKSPAITTWSNFAESVLPDSFFY